MLCLVITPKLRQAIDIAIPGHEYTDHVPVSVLLQYNLATRETLRGSRVYHPPKQPKPVNVEYQARMAALRETLEEREYQSIIASPVSSSLASTNTELRELRNQISTILNVLISIFTAAMAAWYWTPHWRVGSRVLASLGSAIGLGSIEAFLYFRYLAKIEQSREYEERKSR